MNSRPRVIGRRFLVRHVLTYNQANLPRVLDGIEIDDDWRALRDNLPALAEWREKHPDLSIQLRVVGWHPGQVRPPWPGVYTVMAQAIEMLKPQRVVWAIGSKGEMWQVIDASIEHVALALFEAAADLSIYPIAEGILPVGVPNCDVPLQDRIRLAWHFCQFAAAAGVTLQANCWGDDDKWSSARPWSPNFGPGAADGVPERIGQFEFANLWAVPPAQRSLEPGQSLWQDDEQHFRRMLEQAREIEAAQIVLYRGRLQYADKLIAEVWPEAGGQ